MSASLCDFSLGQSGLVVCRQEILAARILAAGLGKPRLVYSRLVWASLGQSRLVAWRHEILAAKLFAAGLV